MPPRNVMVLNDGETYSSLDGCSIISIPEEIEQVEEEEFIKDAIRIGSPSIITIFLDQLTAERP